MSNYIDAVTRGLQGMTAVSTGACPGCDTCMEHDGYDDAAKHREAWHSCDISDEAEFSWRACGICGSSLGGNREVWHWIDPNDPTRAINHEHDACTDCVMFLANGDEPEHWER